MSVRRVTYFGNRSRAATGQTPRSRQFSSDEPLAVGIKRITRLEIDSALEHVVAEPHPRNDAIRRARKCLRRARAVLRLVEAPLGAKAYRGTNTNLRDAVRRLAPARDAAALVEALDRVARAARLRRDD